jgi:hypothetical protein
MKSKLKLKEVKAVQKEVKANKRQGSARLMDKAFRLPFRPPGYHGKHYRQEPLLSEIRNEVLKALEDADCFVVDNVCRYFFEHYHSKSLNVTEDFPCLAPPGELFWMEMNFSHPEVHPTYPKQWGVAFEAFTWEEWVEFCKEKQPVALESFPIDPTPIRWMLRCCVYCHTHDHLYGPIGNWIFPLDHTGKPITLLVVGREDLGEPHETFLDNTLSVMVFPALLALCFLNCKNVRAEKEPLDPHFAKIYQKKHKKPLMQYKTLKIEGMKSEIRKGSKAAGTGIEKGMHICRGHFKTFTEDKPLFGRVTGRFFFAQHVRGKKEKGVIVKDYDVRAAGDLPMGEGDGKE